MSASKLRERIETPGCVTENFGDTAPLNQHIEAIEAFTLEEINRALIQIAINKQPVSGTPWGGRVQLAVNRVGDEATVSATVYVWKEQ